jgi:hypothetical protein
MESTGSGNALEPGGKRKYSEDVASGEICALAVGIGAEGASDLGGGLVNCGSASAVEIVCSEYLLGARKLVFMERI